MEDGVFGLDILSPGFKKVLFFRDNVLMRTGLADFSASPATTSLVVVAEMRMVEELQSSPPPTIPMPEESVHTHTPRTSDVAAVKASITHRLRGNSRRLEVVLAEARREGAK